MYPIETTPSSRHRGCFTAWLVLMLIANAATAISTLLMFSGITQRVPVFSGRVTSLIVIEAIVNGLFAIALFKGKRWGFHGFVISAVIALITNLSVGLGIGQSIPGWVGIPLLYYLMSMGKSNERWSCPRKN